MVFIFFIIKGVSSVENLDISEDFIPEHFISVVVAIRNEEHTISNLIEDLKKQFYPNNLFEVILVNDHSTDDTANVVNENIKNSNQFAFLELTEEIGKKAALQHGYNAAKGEFILTIDADCGVNENWILAYAYAANQLNADLILGPVKYHEEKGFLHQFQEFEQLALQAVTIGSVGIKNPILSNGANMIFRKTVLDKINDPLSQKYASGDDIFLLQNIKRDKQLKVAFAKSKEAMVETKAAATLREMFAQHMRWFSKSKGYTDFFMILSAGIIGMANFTLFVLFILCVFNFYFLQFFMLGLLLKTFVDLALLISAARMHDRKIQFSALLFHELMYSFFSVAVFVGSFLFRPLWKGRKI